MNAKARWRSAGFPCFSKMLALPDLAEGYGQKLRCRFVSRSAQLTLVSTNLVADQLRRLWDSGIRNTKGLHLKLPATGFTGSCKMELGQYDDLLVVVLPRENVPTR